MMFGPTVLSTGTGVLYSRNDEYYIVTAWHNVTGLHSHSLTHLSEAKAVPDRIVASVPVNIQGAGVIRTPVVLPLHDEERASFFVHPENWPRIDVVAIPFDPATAVLEMAMADGQVRQMHANLLEMGPPGVSTQLCPVQKYLAPASKVREAWLDTVEVTEELFIPGYPENVHDYYAQPVWKRATIASSVQQGWNRERKFLVDSASKRGMSGSPVLHYSPKGIVRVLGTTHQFNQDVAILAGIYVGRIGVIGDSDPQIGTVWHASVIDEIIDGRSHELLPEEIEVSGRILDEAILQQLGTCSRQGLDNIRNDQLPSRHYVLHRLLEALKGRVSPQRAMVALLHAADHYDGPLVSEEGAAA